jgi:hypothetical protein
MHALMGRILQCAHALARAAGRPYIRTDDVQLAHYINGNIRVRPSSSSWIIGESQQYHPWHPIPKESWSSDDY